MKHLGEALPREFRAHQLLPGDLLYRPEEDDVSQIRTATAEGEQQDIVVVLDPEGDEVRYRPSDAVLVVVA